ncbi:cation diffusion facilitator family transporter [Cellulomonas cellasea]|uniref:cation diffusion facilitator family transporter n=1 Tax=Cellulomonas cellasea TaxID=43670 RepID=UPI0025A35E58|nr:cation diffusion facilitator family transporter [Cellulomonas cellasea]MDM8086491.1 cation diffusion facilitator family transporter [Cellulomonas cellasea]
MGHDHHHIGGSPAGQHRGRLAVAFGITTAVLVAQVVGALLSGSLSLLVDSAHMLTDAGGLLMALVAASLVTRPATDRRTWGLRRAEVLAATAQAAVLLIVGVYVLVEAVRRLFSPAEVASTEMLVFGVIGLVGNLVALGVLAGGRSSSFNMRAAFLEVLNDALGSVAVIIAAIVIALTGWTRADAVVALLIGALILPRTWKLLRETVDVLLESTPRGLDLESVRSHLLGVPRVIEVHDLHVTQIATGLPVLTAHVVVDDSCFHDGHAPQMLDALQSCVAEHFPISIEHSTFQLEPERHAQHERGHHD